MLDKEQQTDIVNMNLNRISNKMVHNMIDQPQLARNIGNPHLGLSQTTKLAIMSILVSEVLLCEKIQ